MKLNNLIKYAVCALLALGALVSCVEREIEVIEEMNLKRCLEPMNLEAKVNSALGDVVTFSWDVAKDADYYELSVYTDEARTQKDFSETVDPASVPLVKKLTADKTYWFTVQAFNEKKEPSRIAVAEKSVKTYAVKDNLYLKVSARESTSVSLAWSKEVADFQEVDRIEYAPVGASEAATRTLSADEIGAAAATVTGLTPSTEYVFTLYFLSASRGQVDVWTTPDVSGYTEVATLEALKNAVLTNGAKIRLMQAGSPYEIGSMDIQAGFSIIGEETADGSKPVLSGEFHIADAWTGKDLYFEGVQFDGSPTALAPSGYGFAIQNKNGGTVKGKNIGNLTYKNCVITNYTKGLMYEWGNDMVFDAITYDGCEISKINPDGTVGGDVFDIRQATAIGSLSFVNNTITQGMRTFIRIDAGTMGALVVENNTVWNLNFVDNTNNGGFFGLQIIPGTTSFKNNLFLGMVEKATLGSANAKYKTADDISVAAANNWYYDVVETYFTDSWPAAKAGFTALSDAPCYNAAGGYFNILPDSAIAGKNVGAPKWWTPYVEEPEDLTQNVITGSKTWNLGNARNWSGTIKKQMVREELLLAASEANPVVAADGTLQFAAAAVTDRNQVPADNYLAFKVAEPGSVVARAAGEGTAHFYVATQPVAGGAVTVKGGVSATADAPATQKILVLDVTGPSWVFVCPTGEVALAELAWSTDVSAVNTALPAPAPKAEPSSFTAGEAVDVVVSWEAVPNAASYSVVFNGKTYAADGLQYVVEGKTTSMLDAGSYTLNVYANPGSSDIYNTQSEAGTAAFAVLPKGGSDEGDVLVVKDTEALLAAIAAGKDAVTLAAGEYKLGGPLVITAPLALKGQDGAVVYGGFRLSGAAVGSFSAENLTVIGSDADNKADIFLDLDNTEGVTASEVTIRNTVIDGFAKSVIYASNTADKFAIDDITFYGVEVKNHGTGQGVFDLRNGAYKSFTLQESTVTGGRDFLRIDAPCSIYSVLVKNNTLNNLNATGNAGGVFCVRATPSLYEVSYNIIANIQNSISGRTAAMVPKMKKNVYFNIADKYYTGCITADNALDGGGVLLSADPFKDAANGDYTLTNAVVMSLGAGASKWNPAIASVSEGNSITVASVEEFTAAVEAGKTDIAFADGEYDLSATAITLTAGMQLKAEGHSSTIKIGQIGLAEGELGNIVIERLNIIGDGAHNYINVAGASVVRNFTVRNCSISKIGKSLFYGNADGSSFDAVVFQNVEASELGGGQGTIDIRKGSYGVVSVEGCTIVGGRDFIRADAGTVTGAVKVVNNTFDGVTLNNGNGILYVRSTPETYIFKNNLFLNENGANNLLSKASGVTVPDQIAGNFFYNCVAEKFWTGLITQELATSGGGVILANNPVADAANGDYTLVDGLCLASNVGAPRWNPNAGFVLTDVTVSNVAELTNAIDAGKTGIELKAGTYDLREANESGVINLISSLSLTGRGKVEIIGGFKLGVGTFSFTADGILFSGAEKALGNALEIAEATELDLIKLTNCEFAGFNKSLFYGNGTDSKVGVFSFEDNLVHGFGTGQGMLDIRKGAYGTVSISRNSFYDGGRDFARIDKDIAGSIAIVNNTFAACSVDAGNGLLWIRSLAAQPDKYVVKNNLFLNIGNNSLLAKTGATVPAMSNNWFFNVGEKFFTGAISQEVAAGNGGGVLTEDPCAGSATFDLKLTNAELKKADVGDPRWNSASPRYSKRK